MEKIAGLCREIAGTTCTVTTPPPTHADLIRAVQQHAQTASEATPTSREHLRALGALPEKLRPFLARPWSPRAQTAQRERMPPRDRQCAPNALQEPMPTALPRLLVVTAPSRR